MQKEYHALTSEQIALLESRGCRAECWDNVRVAAGFLPERLDHVSFGGTVLLGTNDGLCGGGGPVELPCGIARATLYDCTVGDGVRIANIGRYIARYDIGDHTLIENVGEIYCKGVSAFGSGTPVSVINEGGGREVPICDNLTAQVAYIVAMYRQRSETIARIGQMIARQVESKSSSRGTIGAHCTLLNTTSLVNVLLGDYATVDGAQRLCNGTINSTQDSPSYVGAGVTARDFILARSARVDTGSMLRGCFVGEGSLVENGFSAENTLFFANCHCSHGEACAVFAGPYTASHHRASLLIAGYFSFFNAGSGANQSNHLYKTGPVHQGIHLRGCKFGSDAYVLLPARTGVFTLITGRHTDHHDTDQMPFSYLIEEGGESLLVPGVALRSIGTARDVDKWPRRDLRQGVASDLIRYEMLNPYTAGKILKAISLCRHLLQRYPAAESFIWKRVRIRTSSLRKGLSLYLRALQAYLGERLAGMSLPLQDAADTGRHEWVDLAGMLLPRGELLALLEAVDAGEVVDIDALQARLCALHADYDRFESEWVGYALGELLGKPAGEITAGEVEQMIAQGGEDRAELEAALRQDSHRDRAMMMAVGYGLDFDTEQEADFRAVRGS